MQKHTCNKDSILRICKEIIANYSKKEKLKIFRPSLVFWILISQNLGYKLKIIYVNTLNILTS